MPIIPWISFSEHTLLTMLSDLIKKVQLQHKISELPIKNFKLSPSIHYYDISHYELKNCVVPVLTIDKMILIILTSPFPLSL